MQTDLFKGLPPLPYMIASAIRLRYTEMQAGAGLTDYEVQLLCAIKIGGTKDIGTSE